MKKNMSRDDIKELLKKQREMKRSQQGGFIKPLDEEKPGGVSQFVPERSGRRGDR